MQQELIRCFFHYVWPALPIIDACDFLTTWLHDSASVSPLLRWSIFFSAASYLEEPLLETHRTPSKLVLKEQYYQAAKDIHDCRAEPDKTVLMQSALLLSTWYIDLEDRDGLTHWTGIAMNLAYTIGLHRTDKYDDVQPPPFPNSIRRIWRNIWWSIYYRDIWTAFGLGRPMRVNSDDCDVPMPRSDHVFGADIASLPPEIRPFVPEHLVDLAEVWLNFLELSARLEHVLKTYYRPRSPRPTLKQIEQDEHSIMLCRERLAMPRFHDAPVLALHVLHVRAYYR